MPAAGDRDDLEPHFAGEYSVTCDSAEFWNNDDVVFFADRGRLLNVDDMHSKHPPTDHDNKGDNNAHT